MKPRERARSFRKIEGGGGQVRVNEGNRLWVLKNSVIGVLSLCR